MRPMILCIRQEETGARILALMKERGYTVKDVQQACGFENPQSVYRWIRGDILPSVEKLVILSRILKTDIERILVVDEVITRFEGDTADRKAHAADEDSELRIAC